ncbi:phytoene synthase [Altererythrobacter sp. B11]|uniref:phytoene/squalene synthase family protein n=1 Tax=Altererythrobacter sp. B11 TaxID=2060312 RepID=UPI000DC73AF3|nr:phytoene/squalene synthase family protein [Altererythrobacter sp. B11]BBC74361.1 phytoene synthase [Altererythrobacter sp. B11]
MPRPRLLAPSRILRTTPRQVGGGRPRAALVERARQSIARGSRSFALASQLFDRQTRERAWLLYAWCRRCDDIADGQDHGGALRPDEEGARDRIEAIRVLTARALDGQPTADIAFDALGQVAAEAHLTAEMADDVIEGFALDAAGWRPRSEADMMRYCYHVAGAVGVMMARVMGVAADDHDTLDRACDLGLAFQLNNIARDLLEDDAAGRCYLPVEWLVEADIPPGQHMKPAYRAELVEMAARLVDIADEHEAAARVGAARLRFRQRWAVLAAANIYGAIGREVRTRGAAAWDHRVHTSALAKLGHVAAAFLQALRRPPQPAEWPRWTRGEILVAVRMAGPVAPIPMTPLPDDV